MATRQLTTEGKLSQGFALVGLPTPPTILRNSSDNTIDTMTCDGLN